MHVNQINGWGSKAFSDVISSQHMIYMNKYYQQTLGQTAKKKKKIRVTAPVLSGELLKTSKNQLKPIPRGGFIWGKNYLNSIETCKM